MIVLDEQLLGRNLENAIAAWYPGTVCFVTDLRPGTVIKDEAIPALLSRERQPTFVTLNESDFWRRVAITEHFCVICFALPDSQAASISPRLQRLFRHPAFRNKALRMGHVVRVSPSTAHYYNVHDHTVRLLDG